MRHVQAHHATGIIHHPPALSDLTLYQQPAKLAGRGVHQLMAGLDLAGQVSLVRHDAGTMVAFAYAAARHDSIITHRGARMRTSNIRRAAQVNRVTPGN